MKWRDIEHGQAVNHPDPGAGAGIKTGAYPRGSGCIVVDLDSETACDTWNAMGGDDVETYTVETPRGWHLYFLHPGFRVGNSAGELGKGIDIRGDGGFVVAPNSPHASGKRYKEVDESAPVAAAPAFLIEWLQARKAPAEVQPSPGDVEGVERERRRYLYASWLKNEAPPCVQGGAGDKTLFDVVQRGAYDMALPTADVLELIQEHYDPRCDPPWGDVLEERVLHKAKDAKESSTRPRAEPLPADLAHLATPSVSESFTAKLSALPEAPDVPSFAEDFPGEVWGRWDEPVQPPVYLLGSLIPEGTVVTFFAEGGSLKSWAAFSLAISISTGRQWLDKYAVKQGRTFILDYEDGRYEFQRRMQILRAGGPLPELGYLYGGPAIHTEEFWLKLGGKIKREKIRLVVVDALNSAMPGNADENDTSFSAGMKMAGRLAATEGVTFVFVHHANKSGSMRGTSTVRDQSDVVFKFEPVSETDSSRRMRMVCDKAGPQKKPKPVNVELSDEGLKTFDDAAADAGRNATTPDAVRSAVLLALQGAPFASKKALRIHLKKKTELVDAAIDALLADGAVVLIPEAGGYVLDGPAARRQRMLDALAKGQRSLTPTKIAKLAYVDVRELDKLLLEPEFARERVLAEVRGSDKWTSDAHLARAALVGVPFVQAMLDDGLLIRKSLGGGDFGGFMIPSPR